MMTDGRHPVDPNYYHKMLSEMVDHYYYLQWEYECRISIYKWHYFIYIV